MPKYKVAGRTFKVYIVVDASKPIPKILPDSEKDKSKDNPNIKIEWAEFLYWDWKLMTKITGDARNIDGTIDPIKLRELKLKYLLLDWSLEEDGKKIEIKRKKIGEFECLAPECYEEISKVNPLILISFLNKADLVLELGAEEEDFFTGSSPNTGETSTLVVKQS